MNKAKTYNKGVESGLKVAQKIIEQEVEAMDYLKAKIDLLVDGHDEMKMAVDRLIKDADEIAISNLFKVSNTATPSELKDHEKQVLLNVMATLSVSGINDAQREYQNNLRHHMNMKGYQPDSGYNYKYVSKLESVRAIKIIAKAVRIFLYLEEESWDSAYRYEEELFNHFEIRGFDEIDAQIDLLVYLFGSRGLIELYGDFNDKGEFVQQDLSFLSPDEKEYKDINRECAGIYFKDCYVFDSNKQYIESSSYIIFSDGSKIKKLSKISGAVSVLLSEIENAAEFIREGYITTYFDMAYFVKENNLFYMNLDDDSKGLIFHIPEEKNEKGMLYEIKNLLVYKGRKLVFDNGKKYIVDFEKGISSLLSLSLGFVYGNSMCMRGDYLYFIDWEIDMDNPDKVQHVIRKYGLNNNQITTVSKPFGVHKQEGIYALYDLHMFGMHDEYYYCIFSYSSEYSMDNLGFQCFRINVEKEDTTINKFYIWESRIYQMEQYKNKLLYVNADKDYSIVSHDFVTDKKMILIKKYGKNEKSTLVDRFTLGKEMFQRPGKYMRLGKWIWIKKPDKLGTEIISI